MTLSLTNNFKSSLLTPGM